MTDFNDEYVIFKRTEWETWWLASGGTVNQIPPVIAVSWDQALFDFYDNDENLQVSGPGIRLNRDKLDG